MIARSVKIALNVFLFSCLLTPCILHAAVKGTPVIIVNKTKITKERIDSLVEFLAETQFSGRVLTSQERDYLEKAVAGNLVSEELLKQEANNLKIKVNKEEADSMMHIFKSSFNNTDEYKLARINRKKFEE
jgi:hypothetical protein